MFRKGSGGSNDNSEEQHSGQLDEITDKEKGNNEDHEGQNPEEQYGVHENQNGVDQEELNYYEAFKKRQMFIEREVRNRNKPAIQQLEGQIAELGNQAKQQATNKEAVVDIRVRQLALTKILVMVYEKSEDSLVKANYNAGVAYLDFKCYESALYHLNLARIHKFKIDNAQEVDDKSQKVMANILTQLAKCSLEVDNYEDCFQYVEEAMSLFPQEGLDCVQTLKCKYRCFVKMKNYSEAQSTINKIFDIQNVEEEKLEQIAMTNVEKAKIWALKQDFNSAIQDQLKAIDTLIEREYDDPDYIAGLLLQLSSYQQQANKIEEQIESLQKVKSIYNQIYGFKDKRLIKVMRQMSMILLKNDFKEESLNELKEIKKAESQAFGEKSVEVGRTIRFIGTVQFLQNRQEKEFKDDIQRNFAEAKAIFEMNGLKELALEMEQKIKMVEEGEAIKKKQQQNILKQNLLEQY